MLAAVRKTARFCEPPLNFSLGLIPNNRDTGTNSSLTELPAPCHLASRRNHRGTPPVPGNMPAETVDECPFFLFVRAVQGARVGLGCEPNCFRLQETPAVVAAAIQEHLQKSGIVWRLGNHPAGGADERIPWRIIRPI